jgi:hypothetical protein
MLDDNHPLRYIVSQLHIFGHVAHNCVYLFIYNYHFQEREKERNIKRNHEPKVDYYRNSTTLILSSPLLRIGTSLSFLLCYLQSSNKFHVFFCEVHS